MIMEEKTRKGDLIKGLGCFSCLRETEGEQIKGDDEMLMKMGLIFGLKTKDGE